MVDAGPGGVRRPVGRQHHAGAAAVAGVGATPWHRLASGGRGQVGPYGAPAGAAGRRTGGW